MIVFNHNKGKLDRLKLAISWICVLFYASFHKSFSVAAGNALCLFLSFFLSRSFSLSTYTHSLLLAARLPWRSLIYWHRQLLALARLKAVWQDRSYFARWRGWTALAFVSDSFCWLFINCQPAVHSRPSLTELCCTDVCCFCAWHGSSGDSFLVLKVDY